MIRLFTFLLLCTSLFAANAAEYFIAPDDRLNVIVFGEDDLSVADIRVATDGSIAYPLLGVIQVSGLSARQLEQKITALLADGYLVNPRVSVSISSYRPVYVRGEVKSPGGYNYQEGLTVQKAITLAGGFTERASDTSITLANEKQPDKPKDVGLNHRVYPGDVITVDESFF